MKILDDSFAIDPMRPHTGIYYAKSNKLLRNMRSQRHMAAAI